MVTIPDEYAHQFVFGEWNLEQELQLISHRL